MLVGMKLSTARDFRMQAYEAPKPVGRPDTVDSSKRSTTANSTTRPVLAFLLRLTFYVD